MIKHHHINTRLDNQGNLLQGIYETASNQLLPAGQYIYNKEAGYIWSTVMKHKWRIYDGSVASL